MGKKLFLVNTVYERSQREELLLENIILATIMKFTLFCCRLVFAVTYAVLGRI